MLTGEYNVTLDETGRISLPRKLRDILEKDKVVLTRGVDTCLWLYPADKWKLLRSSVMRQTNPFSDQARSIRRRIIGPANELDIDKQGRIPVPAMLKDFAKLSKDCVILGQEDYVEIWDEGRYREYLNSSEDDFRTASEELGARMMKEEDFGDGTGRSYAGASGRDDTVSGAEGQGGIND
jgi:MraZ protein